MQATPMVLVCTDRASRGIDSAHVEHVVLFDFPRDPSEYVRRAGRVSRGAGGTGLVSILVLGRQVRSFHISFGAKSRSIAHHSTSLKPEMESRKVTTGAGQVRPVSW